MKLSLHNIYLLITLVLIAAMSCNNSGTDEVEIFNDGIITLTVTHIEEQRCPADAVCVWEGFASVDMRIESGDESAEITLSTIGDITIDSLVLTMDTTIFNSTITLISLEPLPNTNEVLEIEEYTVNLEVEY